MNTGNVNSVDPMKTGELIKKISYQIILFLIVIQVSLAATWGWAWILFINPEIHDGLLKIAAVSGSAILSGLIARAFLKGHLRITRWLCSIVSFIFSMIGLFYLSNQRIGFTVSLIDKTKTNLGAFFQLVSGGIISWLVLYAWIKRYGYRKGNKRIDIPAQKNSNSDRYMSNDLGNSENNPTDVTDASLTISHNRIENINLNQPGRGQEVNQRYGLKSLISAYLAIILNWVHKRKQLIPNHTPKINTSKKPKIGAQSKTRKKSFYSQRSSIKLVGAEEHRCPYCLEIVDAKEDEVIECPVCHTIHHKSCWEITGTCQVPHIHT